MIVPEVGIHESIDIDVYHGEWDACSSSRLSWMARSAAYSHHRTRFPMRPTPAMRLGTACHHAILEPDLFSEAYMVASQCEGITKSEQRCANGGAIRRGEKWYCRTHAPEDVADDPGIVMVRDDYDKARRMRDAVHEHPAASAVLESTTRRETSVVWDASTQWTEHRPARSGVGDPVQTTVLHGGVKVRCKARPDVLADDLLCDVKTTRDLFGPHDVDRWIAKKMIHMQTAFYRAGLEAVGRPVKQCCLIVCHSEAPHEVGVFALGPDAMRCGDERVRRLLEKYARCVATDSWPGWPSGVLPAEVPAWEQRAMFPEEYGA